MVANVTQRTPLAYEPGRAEARADLAGIERIPFIGRVGQFTLPARGLAGAAVGRHAVGPQRVLNQPGLGVRQPRGADVSFSFRIVRASWVRLVTPSLRKILRR